MKNLINQFLVIITLTAFTWNLSANDRYIYVESKANYEKVVLDISSLEGKEVSCQIINEEGLIVYSEDFTVKNKGLKTYNLENLSEGEYTFILEDHTQTRKYLVTKENEYLQIQETPEVTFKPTLHIDSQKVVNFHLLSLGKNVTIQLFNTQGEEIYTKEYENANTISKKLRMTSSPDGEYTLKVTVGDQTFFEYINV